MKKKPLIERVSDNYDKQLTYQVYLKQLKKARKNKYYLEAIFIEYFFMEDRLRSLLFHMGVLKDRNENKMNKDARKYLVSLYEEKDKKEYKNFSLKFDNISIKYEVIELIIKNFRKKQYKDNPYVVELKKYIKDNDIDINNILRIMNDINYWCDYRNEFIHAAANKNVFALDDVVESLSDMGFDIYNELASIVLKFKKFK